jgi:hypothetical protein
LMISICLRKILLVLNQVWNLSDNGSIMKDGMIETKEIYSNGLWISNLWLLWEHLEVKYIYIPQHTT